MQSYNDNNNIIIIIIILFLIPLVVKILGVKNKKKVKNIVGWSGTSPIRWGPKRYP